MQEMNKAYIGADIGIIPTLFSEGTSLSVLESQASGVPCVVSNVGGLPNLVLHDYNGMVVKPTFEDFKNAIEHLYNNKDILNKYSKRGIDVAQSFSMEHWKNRWKRVFNEVFPL
jgi:glycosyltransferase involved in cell wall biosynthesis